MRYSNSKDTELRTSLGYVKDYFDVSQDKTQEPPMDKNVLLEMFENDPILSTAFDTTVDVATSNGYEFEGSDSAEDELQDIFDNRLDFDMVLPNIMYCILIYGDAFVEMRKENGKITELNVLESTEMKIKYDSHGRVLGYTQQPSWQKKPVEFSPDEIIHFTFKKIGSVVYSNIPTKSIFRSYATKKYADNYLAKIFANFPPRLMYVLKNASSNQIKDFVSNLKQAKLQPHKDLIGLGEIEVKETGYNNWDKGLVDILNYLRQEILMITKVPPIWIGIPDDSNRSNSEAQIRSFETRIKGIHNKIASEINRTLLPALGFNRAKFRFRPFSLMEEKSIIENAAKLKEMGWDEDSVELYLFNHGLRGDFLPGSFPSAMMSTTDVNGKPVNPLDVVDDEETHQGMGGMNSNKLDSNGASKEGQRKLNEANAKLRTQLDTEFELDQYAEVQNAIKKRF